MFFGGLNAKVTKLADTTKVRSNPERAELTRKKKTVAKNPPASKCILEVRDTSQEVSGSVQCFTTRWKYWCWHMMIDSMTTLTRMPQNFVMYSRNYWKVLEDNTLSFLSIELKQVNVNLQSHHLLSMTTKGFLRMTAHRKLCCTD